VYANGTSSVVSEGGRWLPPLWCSHRVFAHVVSPAPASTSASVLQRRENCEFKATLALALEGQGQDTRCQTCSASDRRRRIHGRGCRSILTQAARPMRGACRLLLEGT
jgi:hypothetical protein